MNTDPTSVAALVRMLSDSDLARLVSLVDDASIARVLRLLPDGALVDLIEIARDADRTAPPAATAPAAAPPARAANRTSRRTATAPHGDVLVLVAAVSEIATKGQVTRRALLEETSHPTWIENGWGADRVKVALATALECGAVAMQGKNKGAHYVVTDAGRAMLTNAPAPAADDEGAPVEPQIGGAL